MFTPTCYHLFRFVVSICCWLITLSTQILYSKFYHHKMGLLKQLLHSAICHQEFNASKWRLLFTFDQFLFKICSKYVLHDIIEWMNCSLLVWKCMQNIVFNIFSCSVPFWFSQFHRNLFSILNVSGWHGQWVRYLIPPVNNRTYAYKMEQELQAYEMAWWK